MTLTWPAIPHIPVAWGEVFDKLTILDIKLLHLRSPSQQQSLQSERQAIEQAIGPRSRFPPGLDALVDALRALNQQLWHVEEGKRRCEREQCFDVHFVQLAREVYLKNDQRAVIKRQINDLLGSGLRE